MINKSMFTDRENLREALRIIIPQVCLDVENKLKLGLITWEK